MATSERRDELATIRLLGGTPRPGVRMIALELAPVVVTALAAGRRDRRGRRHGRAAGRPRDRAGRCRSPAAGALVAGSAALALAAGLVTARIALRATPAAAMRVRE